MGKGRIERFIEFLLVGVFLGVTEDMLAVMLATDASFNIEVLGVVVLVSVPFAAFSELIVDNEDYQLTEKIADKVKEKI
ncbi:MAG: hypothetical protein ABEK00_03925 [Candidatus Nanohaloarchaea archaeon]